MMNILRFPLTDDGPQDKPEDLNKGLPMGSRSPGKSPTDRPSAIHELQLGLASDPGRIRDRNEDTSLALQFMLAQQGQQPLPVGFFLIADGMGGHSQGEEASALAARLAARHVISRVYLPFLDEDEGATDRAPINEVLETSMSIAHEAVRRRLPKAGTTMTIALALGDGVYIAHVGDSRAYLGERGRIQCLTQDHSMAARLLEMGQATSDEAALQRNILYKAIGQGAQIEPDILYRDLAPGQYLLLCCDGLWDKVSDQEMSAIIDASPTPGRACRDLVAKANENGGEDNISVILAARGWPLPARGQAGQK
jgi:serine/threonine protein phosphatase PrpC